MHIICISFYSLHIIIAQLEIIRTAPISERLRVVISHIGKDTSKSISGSRYCHHFGRCLSPLSPFPSYILVALTHAGYIGAEAQLTFRERELHVIRRLRMYTLVFSIMSLHPPSPLTSTHFNEISQIDIEIYYISTNPSRFESIIVSK
jgi:hypothetical protein